MKVRDLMTSIPEAVTPDQPVADAAEIMEELEVGCVPVVDDPDTMYLVGALTDRDLAVRHVGRAHGPGCEVRRDMTARGDDDRFVTVRPEDTVDHLLGVMAERQLRRVPVVEDGDRRLVGIVALADVARRYGSEHPVEVEQLLEAVSRPTVQKSVVAGRGRPTDPFPEHEEDRDEPRATAGGGGRDDRRPGGRQSRDRSV